MVLFKVDVYFRVFLTLGCLSTGRILGNSGNFWIGREVIKKNWLYRLSKPGHDPMPTGDQITVGIQGH
jgi:hypothetical protein